jgi:fimbrial chaperone protein
MIRNQQLSRAIAAIAAGGSLLGLSVTGASTAAAQATEDTPAAAQSPEVDLGASLSIAPLRVDIDSDATGATVFLTNPSARELAVQTRLFGWSQNAGDDVYAPSGELTVSPSISMIPPGETQIVRVLRKSGSSAGEKRFRLVVDQLPDPKSAEGGRAETRIRFTLPVFVDRDTAATPALAWRLADDKLEVVNSGGATARIVSLAVKMANGKDVTVGRNVLRYVHGNSTIAWPIGKGCSLGAVTITAQVEGQTVDAQPQTTCG